MEEEQPIVSGQTEIPEVDGASELISRDAVVQETAAEIQGLLRTQREDYFNSLTGREQVPFTD